MLRRKASTLLTIGMIALLCISINYVYAPDPSIFVDPASTIGEGTPAPGSIFQMKVNVSDIPEPGLWAYQFYLKFNPDALGKPIIPLTNMNFTSDVSGWTTTHTVTYGTEDHGYDGTTGNPSPGSGSGSLYLKATSAAANPAQISFQTDQQFILGPNWPGVPLFVGLSYSYRMTGNAIGQTLGPYSPTAIPLGTWTNPTYAYTSNNAYANASGDGVTQQYGTYGITLPSGFSPIKVEVGYEAYTAGDENLGLSVSWDGGSTWASDRVNSLGTSDPNTVTWVDFTSATSWTSTKLSNTNFRVRVKNVNVDAASNVYLDWIPVRVTVSGSYMNIRMVTPSGTRTLLSMTYIHETPWTYVVTTAAGSICNAPGTYTFRLVNYLRANASGTDKYIQFNWDDVGFFIAPISSAEGAFLKTGGSTDWLVRWLNQTTLYVANTLSGTPYSTAFPVTGSGTVAHFNFTVNYGSSPLDLTSVKLLTLGAPPSYPPVEIESVSVQDGYFRNALTGDLNGDRQVNSDDLIVFEEAYGSIPGMPKWDDDCDLFVDNKIDVKDLRVLGKNYGRSIP